MKFCHARSGAASLSLPSAGVVLFIWLCLALSCAASVRAAAVPLPQGTAARSYLPVAVAARPGLHCTIAGPGAASPGPTVFTDDDGYARFYAVRKTAADAVPRLALNCADAAGKPASFVVDLTADKTFAPHPIALSQQRGIDRPALAVDPLRYTRAQLITAGYGLRPDPAADPAAYARWLNAASRPGKMLTAIRPNTHSHGVTTLQGSAWVGSVLSGKPSYVSTEAVFNVPTGVPGGDGTTTTEIALWNGLGGFGTGSGLIQGGVDIYTTPSVAVYSSWREYCCGDADSNGYGGAFTPKPGDQIYSQEWYCDANGSPNLNGGYGCTYLVDQTSGAVLNCTLAKGSPCWSVAALPQCSTNPKAANCMTLGSAAEFIIENQSPQVSPTSTAFTDFTPAVTIAGSAYSSQTGSYSQTIATDPDVYLLTDSTKTTTHMDVSLGATNQTYFNVSPTAGAGATIWSYTGQPCNGSSCPGWLQLDDNPSTVAIAGAGSSVVQLQNSGKVWLSNGAGCSTNSCPGWQMLDDNTLTVNVATDGQRIYELHNTGKIFGYTGTACTGTACPGWRMLDDNVAAVQIAADSSQLYELHNTGKIFQYTGMPCSGSACPGWRMLDDNPAAVSIAAGGAQLYELHNDGSIYRATGAACTGTVCPGWQMLDDNPAAVAISASNGLYQLHADGTIYGYTGTPCSARSCPGWQMLDDNPKAVSIFAASNQLFELQNDGLIYGYTGAPCSGAACPGWRKLDGNPLTGMITASQNLYQLHTDPLYQLHADGSLFHYTGTPCNGNYCAGWVQLDNNPHTVATAAADGQLYELHTDGSIWRHNGTACAGSACPGWIELDKNPRAKAIVAGGSQLYQLHSDGTVWRHTGTPCAGSACPGWIELDMNPRTTALAAGASQLYELHSDGSVWRHTGVPCSGASCPGWQELDANPAVKAIVAGTNTLDELHTDGSIWRSTGTPCTGTSCPGWQQLDNNHAAVAIAAGGKELVELHNDGSVWLSTGMPCSASGCGGWQMLDDNRSTVSVKTSGTHIYERHSDGSIWQYAGPPCSGTSCPGWTRLDDNAGTRAITAAPFN